MKKTGFVLNAVVLTALLLAAVGIAPVAASPSTVWVCPGATCSHSGAEYATIQAGINAVDTGGTVYVAAGTYNEQLSITKALTLVGQSSATTTIAGGSPLAPAGESVLITINLTAGNVTVSGFTISNVNKYFDSVSAKSSDPTPSVITFFDNKFLGSNLPSGGAKDYDFGFMAGSLAKVVLTNNTFSNYYSNSILMEKQVGPTQISYNTFTPVYDTIYYMTYGGANVTSLQQIDHNTFDMTHGSGAAITINSNSSNGGNGGGKYTNVVITDNTITNLMDTAHSSKGISLFDNSSSAGAGTINVVIRRNKISGSGQLPSVASRWMAISKAR